jgi:hypothetical protein
MAYNNHYPSAGTGDWIAVFASYEEALAQAERFDVMRTITKGKRKGETEVVSTGWKIGETIYDWITIIDLRDWTERESSLEAK